MSLLTGIQQKSANQIIEEVDKLTKLDELGKFLNEKNYFEIINLLKELKERNIFKPIENAIPYYARIVENGMVFNRLCFPEKKKNLILKIQANDKEKNQYIKTVLIKNNAIYIGDLHGDFSVLETKKAELEYFLEKGWSVILLGDLMDMRTTEQKDRSIAVLLSALLLSIRYEGQVVILRGNHETKKIFSKYGKESNNNWLYQFYNRVKIISLLDEIFAKLPITALHIKSKGYYFVSHGGPIYFDKNEPFSFTLMLGGGFIDKEGNFTDPNEMDENRKVKYNNCLWNDVLDGFYIDSNVYKDVSYREGDPNQDRGNGCFVGFKTKKQYKNIIGYIHGHTHINISMWGNSHSILTGNCFAKANKKHKSIVGVVKENGVFSHRYFSCQSILSPNQCRELKRQLAWQQIAHLSQHRQCY